MIKKFDEKFWTNVVKTIEDIENNSVVEIVVLVKPQSYHYENKVLWWSYFLMVLVYSFFMFSPIEFDVYLIYICTVLSYLLFFTVISLIKPLKRLIVGKKQMLHKTEIYARALFQKAGIRFTEKRIGVLFFISVFERRVIILADRGAQLGVPSEEWKKIEQNFSKIFNSKDPAQQFIKELKSLKPIFNKYLPPVENDINELPDKIKIDL